MARLLIRSGKDPFTPVVAKSTPTQDVLAYEQPFPHPPWYGAGSRHARIQAETTDRLNRQRDQIDELAGRLTRLERLTPRGFARSLGRWLRRTFKKP